MDKISLQDLENIKKLQYSSLNLEKFFEKNNKKINIFFESIENNLKNFYNKIENIHTEHYNNLLKNIELQFKRINLTYSNENLTKVYQKIDQQIKTFENKINSTFQTINYSNKEIKENIKKAIDEKIQTIFNKTVYYTQQLGFSKSNKYLQNFFMMSQDLVKLLFKIKNNFLKNKSLINKKSNLKNIFKKKKKGLKEILKKESFRKEKLMLFKNMFKPLSFLSKIFSVINIISGFLKKIFNFLIINSLFGIVKKTFDFISKFFSGFSILNIFTKIKKLGWEGIKKIGKLGWKGIKKFGKLGWKRIKKIGKSGWKGIKKFGKLGWKRIKKFGKNTLNLLKKNKNLFNVKNLLKKGIGISGVIGGIEGIIESILNINKVSKEATTSLEKFGLNTVNIGKKVASNILSGLTIGLVSSDSIEKVIKSGELIVTKLFNTFDITSDEYKKDIIEKSKKNLNEKSIKIFNIEENIINKLNEKGISAQFSSKMIKKYLEDSEILKLFNQEEINFLKKRANIKAAKGFLKKEHIEKIDDLFKPVQSQTEFLVGENGPEWVSILNKNQYDKLKNILNTKINLFNFSIKKNKNVNYGKKLIEKNNFDEFQNTFSDKIEKDFFILKDSTVDIEGLQPFFKYKVFSLLKDYYNLTQKKAQINSAFRTKNLQEKLYNLYPNKAAKPGTSPHEKGIAVDINTEFVEEMKKLNLLSKYNLKTPARTKSGQLETWHIQAKFGAAFENAPKDFILRGHAGEGAYVAKTKEFKTVFQYFELGKKLAEEATNNFKNMNLFFTKDLPGKNLNNFYTQISSNNRNYNFYNQIIKILNDIKNAIINNNNNNIVNNKDNKNNKQQEFKKPIINQSNATNYKERSEVLPSDILLINLYSLLTQFNRGY